ncbi:MAG: hypothetical protein QNK43_10290 [Amphritea sp.]|nr:hypothetical protein [Amphritea sp.]
MNSVVCLSIYQADKDEKGISMAHIEELELSAHRSDMIKDVNNLIEKYRTIFEWDVPDIDENLADTLILNEVRKALDDVQNRLLKK